jgi:hypothetical protein
MIYIVSHPIWYPEVSLDQWSQEYAMYILTYLNALT